MNKYTINEVIMIYKYLCMQQQTKKIKQELEQFESNIASIQDIQDIKLFLNDHQQNIQIISIELNKLLDESERSNETLPLDLGLIDDCETQISRLLKEISKAENQAKIIVDNDQQIIENLIAQYTSAIQEQASCKKSWLHLELYTNLQAAGGHLWSSWYRRQNSLSGINVSKTTPLSHSLASLISMTDAELVTEVHESLILEGEIGHLIIQRLRSILYNPKSEIKIKIKAAKLIKAAMNNETDGIFKCDFPALESEISKLILHAKLHPEQKTIWLGSARSVNAIIENKTELGTYLNCDDNKHSWLLNRLWLQIAINLGYSIELVEQQYPRMEHALMAQDGGALFIQTLHDHLRSDPNFSSQYTSADAPTATSQEILALFDMGCVVSKGKNQRIQFSRNPKSADLEFFRGLSKTRYSPLNSRSWEQHATSTPPLNTSPLQCWGPNQSSATIRSTYQFESLATQTNNDNLPLAPTLLRPQPTRPLA